MAKTKKSTSTNKRNKKTRSQLRDGAVMRACKLLDTWEKFTRDRLNAIKEMELSYYGQVRPTLKGRSNFPFPVLAKYIDAVKARLDDLPLARLDSSRKAAQYQVVQQAQAAITSFKKPNKGDWARHDRIGRINSLFSGYCGMEFYTEVDRTRGFLAHARPVDHNDLVFEPMGGSDLEEHCIVGKYPIFKSEDDLYAGVDDELYDEDQVERLLNRMSDESYKKNGENLMGKFQRYKALGLDIENNSYAGQRIVALAEVQMEYEGKRWLLTFDPQTRIAVRFQTLKDVFSSELYSIVLYQTHEDGNVVMCKSIADDVFPISEAMRVKVNQMFDASTKELWSQRIIDPSFFPDPSELEWRRPDQIVVGRLPDGRNSFSEGMYTVQNTFDYSNNLAFMKWMDEFIASLVGINPNDLSEDQKRVGVLFGQLAKSGAMMNIQNKSYSDMWQKGIYRILYGMHDNMTEALMVKTIGTKGAEWHEFSTEELGDPEDYDIIIEGSTVEAEMNEALMQRQEKVLLAIAGNPELSKETNPRALNEQLLKIGKIPEEQIVRLLDTKNFGKEKQIARADMAIEELLEGKTPKLYQGADITFYEYLLDYANDLDDSDETVAKDKLAILYYGRKHKSIVIKNQARQAIEQQAIQKAAQAAENPTPQPGLGAPEPAPAVGKNPQPSPTVIPSHVVARNKAGGLPPPVAPPAGPAPAGPMPAPVIPNAPQQ